MGHLWTLNLKKKQHFFQDFSGTFTKLQIFIIYLNNENNEYLIDVRKKVHRGAHKYLIFAWDIKLQKD